MKQLATLSKYCLIGFTLLFSVPALPARADFIGTIAIGLVPPSTIVYGDIGRLYFTSSLTSNVTTYDFIIDTLPSTTPGAVSRYTYGAPSGSRLVYLNGVPVQQPNEFVEFTGGALDGVFYYYEQGSRSTGFTIFSFSGLTYTDQFIPPVGPTGPIGSGTYDTGTISFFPASAVMPEPSGLAMMVLGFAGLPARLLWRRFSHKQV